MAKRLTPQQQVERLRAEGYSRAEIGAALGRSSSQIGRIERGETSGGKLDAGLREFRGMGKKARENVLEGRRDLQARPTPAPRPKPAPTPPPAPEKPIVVSPLERAEAQLIALSDRGVDKVVIYINLEGVGKSVTLGANGGIDINLLLASPSLSGFLEAQAAKQKYKIKLSGDDADVLISIEFEEYE